MWLIPTEGSEKIKTNLSSMEKGFLFGKAAFPVFQDDHYAFLLQNAVLRQMRARAMPLAGVGDGIPKVFAVLRRNIHETDGQAL
jgi:hypothetical protein